MGSRKGSTQREPYVYPSRAHPRGSRLVPPAVQRATALVTIVRDEDANAVARIIDPLSWEQMAALVVVLAAMVPDDRSVEDLTAWVHDQAPDLRSVG
jgi:hypothetical protein